MARHSVESSSDCSGPLILRVMRVFVGLVHMRSWFCCWLNRPVLWVLVITVYFVFINHFAGCFRSFLRSAPLSQLHSFSSSVQVCSIINHLLI